MHVGASPSGKAVDFGSTIRGFESLRPKQEQRRKNLEQDRLDRVMDGETYKRQHKEISDEIKQLEQQLNELEEEREENIDVFGRLMALTDDLHDTYTNAEPNLKEHLIGLFFDKFVLRDKKIIRVKYTKAVQVLLENRGVIINHDWLPLLDGMRTTWMQDIRELDYDLQGLKDILLPCINPRIFA